MKTENLEISVNIHSQDMKMFTGIVNQGIDSRLEGFTQSKFYQGENGDMHRYYFDFHISEIQILLRRMLSLDTYEAESWLRDIADIYYGYETD